MGPVSAARRRCVEPPHIPPNALDARRIPPLGHAEAAARATAELARFMALVRELSSEDWAAPTVCSLWDARQIMAHVTGAAASYAEWREFVRQWNPRVQHAHRQPGFSILDALNQMQVEDRGESSPAALIAELERVGPRAIATRNRLPRWLRGVRLPMPALGVAPIGYLTDIIYTRDMWIHRLDISRAADRPMNVGADHDGRIIALMVRDLGSRPLPGLAGRAVLLNLTGPAGGAYLLGSGDAPAAALCLDAIDFAWLAAGRCQPEEAQAVTGCSGDGEFALQVLSDLSVPV